MKNVIHVDERGYSLVHDTDTDTFTGGCRGPWTREQALAHWGSPDYPDLERGAEFVQAIEGGEFSGMPNSLRDLHLGGGTLPPGTVLPEGLTYLYLGGGTLPPGTVLPEGLTYLYLGG